MSPPPAAASLMSRLAQPGPLLLLVIAVAAYRYGVWALGDDLSLLSEEALYWTWAQDPDWGYLSRPPMIAWLIWLTTHLFGSDAESAVKAGATLIHPLTTMLVYALGRRMVDAETGRDAALLFLLMPAVTMSAVIISADVPLLLFWATALLALWRALQSDAWADWLLLGLAMGLGMLTRYNMAFFAVATLVFALTHRQERRLLLNPKIHAAFAVAALLLLPHLLWNLDHRHLALRDIGDVIALVGHPMHWQALFTAFGAQFLVFGPIAFALLLVALCGLRGWGTLSRAQRLLIAFAGMPLLLFLASAVLGHGDAQWGAPVYVAASILVAIWCRRRWHWRSIALWVNLVLGLFFYHYPAALDAIGVPLQKRYDAYSQGRGWDEVGHQAQRWLQEFPDARLLGSERQLMAELMYYARPLHEPRVWFPPGAKAGNHYELTIPLRSDESGPFIWIVEPPADQAVLQRFAVTEQQADIVVTPYPGLERRYQVWRLDGFRGYAGPD
jgi:4-amino-4-deoxy-L-arabinose transferase-like glycosyltransferase